MQDVIRKLRFRDNGIVLNAPASIEKELVELGFRTSLSGEGTSTNTLVFINNRQEYLRFLEQDLKHIAPDSVLWFAYPKGTSKIKTDINRDTIRATGEAFGITTVTAISIDDTWSALRFRPAAAVGT